MADAAPQPRIRSARVLLGPLAVAATAIAMVLWSRGTWPDPLVDFGQQLYVSWRLAEGEVLYRDIAYHYGPLSPTLNALFFRLFGVGLTTLVVCNLAILAGTIVLLYRILASIGSRFSASIAGITFVTVFAFGQLVPYGNYNFVTPYVYGVTHGLTLSLLGIYGLGVYHRRGGVFPLAGVGLTTGLLFLTKAEVFLAGALAIVLGLAVTLWYQRLARERLIRSAATFAACVLIPPVLCFILLSSTMSVAEASGMLGTWPAILLGDVTQVRLYRWSLGLADLNQSLIRLRWSLLWYGFLLVPPALLGLRLRKPGSYRIALAVATSLLIAAICFGWTVWWPATLTALPLAMLAAGAFKTAGLPRRRMLDREISRRIVALSMIVFATVLMAKIVLNARTFHYGFALAMPATLVALVAVFDWVPARIERAGGYGGLLRAAALAVWAAFIVGHLVQTHDHFEMKTEIVASGNDAFRADWRGDYVNTMLEEIERQVRPEDTLAVLPAGVMLNYLSRRANATPFIYFMPSDLLLYGEERMLEHFRSAPPDFVILVHKDTTEFGATFFGRDYGRPLHDWIRQNYRTVRQVGAPPLQDDRFGMALLRRIEPPAVAHRAGTTHLAQAGQ